VPDIGRGTVYATLAELAELGVLASVGVAEPVRYETNLARHDHFHCRLCLRLFDVELGSASLRRRALPGFSIGSVTVRAEGVCAECNGYLNGLGDGAAGILARPSVSDGVARELSCATIESPVGKLALAASGQGVVRLAFDDHADFELLTERRRSRRGPVAARARLRDVATTLDRYFAGDQRPAEDVVDWRLSGPTNATVLQAVQKIPYAASLSYERLGGGLSSYECGLLMGANPIALLVPCHRVSRGADRPTAYVGGSQRLRVLQDLEAGSPSV
jgi:methylated-DNA-[protein]-cysteine S-methyltransferase